MTSVGSIVFGPKVDKTERKYWKNLLQSSAVIGIAQSACKCIGPQPGESKCPCALRGESEQGRRMIENGVTINGRRYKLVPED